MKTKTWKKALASVLTFAMVVSGFTGFAVKAEAAEDHAVSVEENGDKVVIGNDYISREFSVADGKLSTVKITNKRTGGDGTVFTPEDGSEEFIIRTTKKVETYGALDRSEWTATTNSYNYATGDADGPASNLIDGKLGSIWHTNYGNGQGPGTYSQTDSEGQTYYVLFDLGGSRTFGAFSYTPRQERVDVNGNIADYELYASDSEETLSAASDEWELIASGTFEYDGTNQIFVNLEEKVTATQVKFVPKSAKNGANFAGGAEFNLHADKVVIDPDREEEKREFASSELTLADQGVTVEDTTATVNDVAKTGKKVTFNFEPYTFKDVEYTISEVIVMYDGDHFMRKYMEISVPEAQKGQAEIDYIDLESLKVNASDAQWTIPTDAGGVVAMETFKANLGQPIYIQGMFFGCEFPVADTQIVNGTGYMRYYTGKNFTRLEADNQLTRDGKYVTWQTVAGAARSTEQEVIQADFFEYIKSIATPSDFRIQYNSWFDNMMLINDENILESFIEIDKELNSAEVRPLDSYVVDDGWNAYNNGTIGSSSWPKSGQKINESGFWEFNEKFPEGLTPSSELVQKFGSNFGVWVGPRGGYNFYGTLADILTASGKGSKAGGSIDVADREYVKNFTEMACKWQEEYGVNYWKWDGFADGGQYGAFAAIDGVPGYENRHMTGGYKGMYHVTDLWEAWIDLMEAVRANAKENDINKLWISLTCYVNPSPWYLQWANSVWMQCVYDQKDAGFGTTKMNKQITYRDAMYYDFLENHEFQFPLSNIYNHDPIYGKEGTGMNVKTATDEDFQNYLYMLSTRGTAFWELYLSDSIMTDGKYEVVGEFLEWAEENYDMLKNSKMIGGSPDNTLLSNGASSEAAAQAYGFSCFNGTDGILSLRNPSASAAKTITFTFDRTMGVAENAGTLKYHMEHSYNMPEGTETTGTLEYGETYEITLQPNEVRILRVSAEGDTTAPEMLRAYSDGEKVITVKFDEKVKGTEFTVSGATVESVEQSADDITYRITVADELTDGAEVTVEAAGVTDLAGNPCEGTISFVHNKGNLVAKGAVAAAESLCSDNGFTVVADVATTAAGTLVAQGEEYALGIHEDGTAFFTLNGAKAVSGAVVNDGEEHRIAGVKENNGMLKLYVDGTLEGSAYKEENRYYKVQQAAITVSDQATMTAVHDVAYGYDEIANYGFVAPDSNEISLENAVITASSTSEGDVDSIFDGDATTFWTSGAAATTIAAGNPWLMVDLGETYMLGQVDYTPRYFNGPANYWWCTGNIKKLVVELSTDGENWTAVTPEGGLDISDKIVNVADESLFPHEITFDAIAARYVRISGTESYHWQAANVNKYITVGELALFKAESTEINPEILAKNAMANSEQLPVAGDNDGGAAWAFDDEEHWWHTRYQDWNLKGEHEVGSQKGDGKPSETNPIWIQTGFDEAWYVDHITYLPRSNGYGIIKDYTVSVANLSDPSAMPADDDFTVVKTGTLEGMTDMKTIHLEEPVLATHVRITVTSVTCAGDGHLAAQNISIFGYKTESCAHGETAVVGAEEATCTEAGYTGDKVCTACGTVVEEGQEIPALGHDWGEWTVVEEATYESEGLEERVCARCNDKEERTIPKLVRENPFTDVHEDDYFYAGVLWAVGNDITTGWTETLFAPDLNCTRGQIVTFLWRANGCPEAETEVGFKDVPSDAFYADAVAWAVEEGITDGWTETLFAPDMDCTRGQVVTFLWRAAGRPEAETESGFDDVAEGAYYADAVAWAVANQITEGVNDTAFEPETVCTRGEIVTFIYGANQK
ncbi:MAG: discoidin domain-containing protein [Lachnospiraceae bacterium]